MAVTYEVDTEDFDYLTRDGVALGARMYRPRGQGPFPAMVDGHGGAWILGTFENNDPINRRIAAGGIVVMAVDYSLPPQGTYPSSVADMNYAIRWLKLNAACHATTPDWVGVMGTSAGGHLAALTAIKPQDPRYAAIPLAGGDGIDAKVSCVAALWPVICPYTRFIENQERHATGNNFVADRFLADRVGAGLDQMKYWLTLDAMADGSPMLAVERGEAEELPPTIYIQALCDVIHPRHCMDRFCAAYTKAGGKVEAVLADGEPYDFIRTKPDAPEARRAYDRLIAFIHESNARA